MADQTDYLKQKVLRNHVADLSNGGLVGAPLADRGYVDENGDATDLGSEYLTLLKAGLVDDNGNLTDEGRVYATSHRDSMEDPATYALREERGLNDLDKDANGDGGGFWSMLGDVATKGVPRLAETVYNKVAAPLYEAGTIVPRKIYQAVTGDEVKLPRTQSFDESTNAIAENITGGFLASEPLAAGAIYGSQQLAANIQGKKAEAIEAKRQWELHNSEVAELRGAQVMETLTGADQWMESRNALVAQHGEEAVKADEEVDRITGSFVLDPNNILSMGASKALESGALAFTRASLHAEKMALKAKTLQAAVAATAAERATLEAGVAKASSAVSTLSDRALALRGAGDATKATRYEVMAQRIAERAQPFTSKLDELAATESKLAAEAESLAAKPGVNESLMKLNERWSALKQWTPDKVGQLSEKIGAGLMAIDETLAESGIGKAYSAMRAMPSRVVSMGAGAIAGPLAGVPGAVSQVLASGPILQSAGNFSRILGKELIAERGSVPFWKRVANNSTITKPQRIIANRMAELDLGYQAAKPIIRGTVAAYPMNVGLEVLQDPDHNVGRALQRAASPSLVFGGGSAGAGALFQGTKGRLKQIRIADEINFTRSLTPEQQAGFSRLSRGARRAISTYAATFPNANMGFDNIASYYDPATNTINTNPDSPNPIRQLMAHEVLHYVTIRNQMQPVVRSMLLGDAETPGLLRGTDGKLDPDFKKLSDTYNRHMEEQGLPPIPIERMAEEYFNESVVDDLVSMVESGELSRMAGRTQAGKKIRAMIDAVIPKKSIIRDFFYRTGGVTDAAGRPVMGNGILADGIRELPEAKALMRKMLRNSAGEPARSTSKRVNEKKDGAGTEIPIEKGDPIIDSFHPLIELDANGVPMRDKNGDHIAVSKAKDDMREAAGHAITEAQANRIQAGHMPDANEIQMRPDGTWYGEYIPKELINALAAKGLWNNKQIATLANLSRATKPQKGKITGEGYRFLMTYHPATVKTKRGKIRYATMGAVLRETAPVGFEIGKKGQVLVHLINVEQLHRNIESRAASARGKALYGGNAELIHKDVAAVMEAHSRNVSPDEYFKSQTKPHEWESRKRFINTIFGLMTKAQQDINPMFQSDKVTWKDNVYRTYRVDRLSKATRIDGAAPMPFVYPLAKANYFPDGVPLSERD